MKDSKGKEIHLNDILLRRALKYKNGALRDKCCVRVIGVYAHKVVVKLITASNGAQVMSQRPFEIREDSRIKWVVDNDNKYANEPVNKKTPKEIKKHGLSGYKYGCRCEICSKANKDSCKAWKERNNYHAR